MRILLFVDDLQFLERKLIVFNFQQSDHNEIVYVWT